MSSNILSVFFLFPYVLDRYGSVFVSASSKPIHTDLEFESALPSMPSCCRHSAVTQALLISKIM